MLQLIALLIVFNASVLDPPFNPDNKAWAEPQRITYSVERTGRKKLPTFVVDSIDRAIARWSKTGTVKLSKVRTGGNIQIIYDVTGQHIWSTPYGFCELLVSDSNITHATVVINAYTYDWPRADVALDRVIEHELGHALGLKHSEDSRDIMFRFMHNELDEDAIGRLGVLYKGVE